MLWKQRNNTGDDSVKVGEDGAGNQTGRKCKKCIQKRKPVLECVLGFSIGILTRLLPVEAVAFLLLSSLLLLIFLPLILLSD